MKDWIGKVPVGALPSEIAKGYIPIAKITPQPPVWGILNEISINIKINVNCFLLTHLFVSSYLLQLYGLSVPSVNQPVQQRGSA